MCVYTLYITGKILVLLLIFPFLASKKGARHAPRPQDGNSEKLQLIVLLPDGRCLVTTAKSGNFPPLAAN